MRSFRTLLFLSIGLAHAQTYTFVEFDVPGARAVIATGINNRGQVAGWFTDAGNTAHGFVRSPDGATVTTFDLPAPLPGTLRVNGINNLGQIVGSFSDVKGFHGFIREPDGELTFFEITTVASLPGLGADATGINDLGEVVGAASIPFYGGPGYLRHADGSFEVLRAAIGNVWPAAINNRGEIAGWLQNGGSGGTQHGFLRSPNSDYTKVDLPGTTTSTHITAMNHVGRFVGQLDDLGFVANPDGTFTLLPKRQVAGINDNGMIVGKWTPSGALNARPFIGTPGTASTEPSIRTELPGVLTASAFGGAPSIGPGNWIEIYGHNLASAPREWRSSDFVNGAPPTSLDGVSVSIGGLPAAVSYISPGQVNALVSDRLPAGLANVIVTTGARATTPFEITVHAFQPTVLSLRPDVIPLGSYLIAMFPDFVTYALPPSPAFAGVPTRRPKAGDTIVLFGAGFGPVDPQSLKLLAPITVSFSRASQVEGTVTWAGAISGLPGLYQINVVVPGGLLYPDEEFDNFVSVGVTINGQYAGVDSRQGRDLSVAR
jgi:uncharacterized protein (TIGR03437 family)